VTRRLIEEGLPFPAINKESGRDKSLRHGHISTMHLWWARRPLPMSRAVVFGTVVPDPGDPAERKRLFDALAAVDLKASSDPHDMMPLRDAVAAAWPDRPPRLLDCFAGGGAIPLEALRLGCDVTAVDLNPVAHLVERCTLEYPQAFAAADGIRSLADDFEEWAGWVAARTRARVADAYPVGSDGRRPSVYFWARTVRCPDPGCAVEVPLLTTRWLASERNLAWVQMTPLRDRVELAVRNGRPPADEDPSRGTMRGSSATCPSCGGSISDKEIRAAAIRDGFGHRLYAVLVIDGRRRTYRDPAAGETVPAATVAKLLNGLPETPAGDTAVPDEPITRSQNRTLRNLLYGIDEFRGLFLDRQLLVLGTLCAVVRDAHDAMREQGMDADRATAVATYLGLCVDRVADYNSTVATWAAGGEFVRSAFPQQSIRMAWDFTEIDPLQSGPGDWDGATTWVALALRHCSRAAPGNPARVLRGDAQRLPFADGEFDAVVVDPPYYEAFQYADLSDFFYVWLKRSVGHLHPGVFATPLTPKAQEVISNRAARGSPEFLSAEEYERRLARSLAEMRRVVREDGHVVVVFAHTDPEAWERLLLALRQARLVVTTSWPMESERAARSTALISATLNSSVVLVCAPSSGNGEGFYDDVVAELRRRVADRLDRFASLGLRGADYFVSAVGPAFEVFAQYGRVVRLSGQEVGVPELMVLARQTVAHHAMSALLGSGCVAALDDATLFYLTWRWSYGTADLPADEAYMLERAFDVDLGDLARPGGFVEKTKSTFALLGPQDRRDVRLDPVQPRTIDVLHVAARLWDDGRRDELAALLSSTGVGNEPAFWAAANALAQVLPDGDRERTMLLGLAGNSDALAGAAAAKAAETPSLF